MTPQSPLYVEIAVDERYRILVLHNKSFVKDIAWFEFDIKNTTLDFVLDNGETRGFGMKLKPEIARYMQNAHQILRIQMDDDTGQAMNDDYIPLILHH